MFRRPADALACVSHVDSDKGSEFSSALRDDNLSCDEFVVSVRNKCVAYSVLGRFELWSLAEWFFSSDSEQPINSSLSAFLGIKHSTFHTQPLKCAIFFAERERGRGGTGRRKEKDRWREKGLKKERKEVMDIRKEGEIEIKGEEERDIRREMEIEKE